MIRSNKKDSLLQRFAHVFIFTCSIASVNASAIELDHGNRAEFTKGSLHWVTLSELLPTQPVIAHDQVNYKLASFSANPDKLYDALCESYGATDQVLSHDKNATPADPDSFTCAGEIGDKVKDINTVIVGPGGKLYLTDGHHSFSTFFDMKQGGPTLPVYVQVQENWSSEKSDSAFWAKLDKANNSWRYQADGKEVSYQDMPTSLGRHSLANDPYRGAMYFAKKIGWNKGDAVAINYLEFHWASEFRNKITLSKYDLNDPQRYLNKIKALSHAMIATDSNKIIGKSGYTAAALGQKDKWNKKSDKAFNKLLCNKGKLGKLGFALSARNIDVSCQ